jgi:nucleoside-diphosphate-sugar epimerase
MKGKRVAMNVLVTGATGFIGRHLVERLLGEGHHVTAMVEQHLDAGRLEAAGVQVVRGDVRDYQSLLRAAMNCRVIFHLAARTEASGPTQKDLEEVNIRGTENVAQAALAVGAARLVFGSSVALYGRSIRNRAIHEETVPTPDSPYGRSKFLAEQLLRSLHQREGLPVVLVRLSAVFGPGAMSWLNLFQAIAAGRFRLIGRGDNHHHVADIVDVAEGLTLCGSVAGIEGRTYILAGAESVRLRDLIQAVGEEAGGPPLPPNLPIAPLRLYRMASRRVFQWTGYRSPLADRIDLYLGDRAFDLSRSRQELAYKPGVTTRNAVHRTAAWFKQHGYL